MLNELDPHFSTVYDLGKILVFVFLVVITVFIITNILGITSRAEPQLKAPMAHSPAAPVAHAPAARPPAVLVAHAPAAPVAPAPVAQPPSVLVAHSAAAPVPHAPTTPVAHAADSIIALIKTSSEQEARDLQARDLQKSRAEYSDAIRIAFIVGETVPNLLPNSLGAKLSEICADYQNSTKDYRLPDIFVVHDLHVVQLNTDQQQLYNLKFDDIEVMWNLSNTQNITAKFLLVSIASQTKDQNSGAYSTKSLSVAIRNLDSCHHIFNKTDVDPTVGLCIRNPTINLQVFQKSTEFDLSAVKFHKLGDLADNYLDVASFCSGTDKFKGIKDSATKNHMEHVTREFMKNLSSRPADSEYRKLLYENRRQSHLRYCCKTKARKWVYFKSMITASFEEL